MSSFVALYGGRRPEMPTGSGPTRMHRALPVVAAGGAVWFLLVAPVLRPSRQLGERDTARLFYPVERTVAAALRAGRLPFWEPRMESGTSILGQVTPAALHPFALLYAILPFGFAFKLEHLLALLLGGCGAAVLAAQLGATRWARLFSGIAFGGCGALVSSASGALPYALGPAAAPLAVGAVLWHLRAPSPGRLLASASALALCAYGGDPQSFGIAILVAVVLALVVRPRPRRAMHVGLWGACAFLLCAPAALPAFSQLQRSERKAGFTERERKLFSAPPRRLLGLAVPLAFDGTGGDGTVWDPYSDFVAREMTAPFLNSICIGAPALIFALAALRRRHAIPLLCIAAFLIVASTGDAGHLQPVLETVIPGWKLFRYSEKFLLHVSWLLAVAAALGADAALLDGRSHGRRLVWASALLTVAALAVFLVCVAREPAILQGLIEASQSHSRLIAGRFLDSLRSGTGRVAGLSAAVGAIAVLRLLSHRRELPILLTGVVSAASALISPPLRTVRADLYEGTSATGVKLLEIGGPSEGNWRVLPDPHQKLTLPEGDSLNVEERRLVGYREALWPQLQALDGIDGVAAYFSALDSEYFAVAGGAPNATLDLLAIRFYVVRPGPDAPRVRVQSESGFGILTRAPTRRAFVVHRTVVAANLDDALLHLRSMKTFEEAVVWKGAPLLAAPTSAASSVDLRRPSPERMDISVQSESPGLLVVSEHYDPGWRAQVDGRGVPVHAADVIAIGVEVPEGRHEVRLRFVPVGFVPGVACAASTALLLGALALSRRARARS